MSISSIGSNDLGWQNAGPATRRAASASGSEPNRSEANTAQASRQQDKDAQAKALEGLFALDKALATGDITTARKSLESVRQSAGLTKEPAPGSEDPLAGVAKALKHSDVNAARDAWEGFQEDVRSQLEPTDYSITFTSTTTFSTLA